MTVITMSRGELARLHAMIANRPDWCISRQRTWGVPMAVLVDRRTQTLHPDSEALLRRVADAVDAKGLEAWFGSSVSDWISEDAEHYDKCPDTLDVWFDSGSVHQCSFVANHPDKLDADGLAPQADMYLMHQWIKENPVDLLIGNTYGKYIARDESLPFVRMGFPIVDRIGHSYFPTIGYMGAMRILEKILSALMDKQDASCLEEKFELVM